MTHHTRVHGTPYILPEEPVAWGDESAPSLPLCCQTATSCRLCLGARCAKESSHQDEIRCRCMHWLLQGTGDYVHLGILQSSSKGHPLFMHRAGGDKYNWNSEPHHVTHVTGPITPTQAQMMEIKACCYTLEASKARVVMDLEDGVVEDEKIAVASTDALDQYTQTMLDSHIRRAYDCVSNWSRGSASCLQERWI